MSTALAGAPHDDLTFRDLLSSLSALQALSMVMNDGRSEDEILDLAVSAIPSLSHRCRAQAVVVDGQWRDVAAGLEGAGSGTSLDAEIEGLRGGGGPVAVPGFGWAWAFPLSSRGGGSGYLVVGSAEAPPPHEWTLLQALAQQTGSAVATTRLLVQERVTRAKVADEQATMRRVAALVASDASPEEVFTVVAAEAGRLRDADYAAMSRYNEDRTATIVGSWGSSGHPLMPVGATLEFGQAGAHVLIYETGQPVRMDYRHPTDVGVPFPYDWDVRSLVGVPIHIEGRLWGAIGLLSRRDEPLPADTEAWLGAFTELVAAAIANAQARVELRGIAEEQAALRRVATLVAGAASPDSVFATVAAEVGRVLEVDATAVRRYNPDGNPTLVAGWTSGGTGFAAPAGDRVDADAGNEVALVFATGRPARVDNLAEGATRQAAEKARQMGIRWSAGVPIRVDGRLWGVISVASRGDEPPPPATEGRLAAFTELLGTAVANAEARASLTASRARIVAASDAARHRIQRDLHDGAQQRLVSLALRLRAAKAAVSPDARDLAAHLDELAGAMDEALEELREIAHGIHPGTLARGGLVPALRTLARRSSVPVRLDVDVDGRLAEQLEFAAFCVVSEALTNAAKHAEAGVIDVHVSVRAGVLRVFVRDDGRGGADSSRGSGIVGLTDRVEALSGRMVVHSPPGAGTTLEVTLPIATNRP